MKDWVVATARKGWRGGAWDTGYQRMTRDEAEREAARLNLTYENYTHQAVHVTWPRKRS